MKMIEQSKKEAKAEKIYLAIIMGLQTIDKLKLDKLWDKAIAIKVALDNAGLKIVRKPKERL